MKRFLLQVFTWWNGQTVGTRFHTWRRGRFVGSDDAGNRYYQHWKNDRRWVIYAGYAEPSTVPPGWFGWLHHTSDLPPTEAHYTPRSYEQPHRANLTGTALAYRPPGSALGGDHRPKVTGDYEPWVP